MTLGAIGGRGTLVPAPEGGGFTLALKTDAFWVRTQADAARSDAGNLAASDTDATRLRVALDASRPFALGGGTLTPSLEVGLRHDGGDAETGTGVEFGAGLRYEGDGIAVAGSARWLVAHEAAGYEEWGASGSVRIDPGDSGRGLSLTLAPTVGNAASGTGNLWSAADARGLAPGTEFEAARRLDAEVGYGACHVRRPLHRHAPCRRVAVGRRARVPPGLAADLGGPGRSGLRDRPRRDAQRERQRQCARARGDAEGHGPLVADGPGAPRCAAAAEPDARERRGRGRASGAAAVTAVCNRRWR